MVYEPCYRNLVKPKRRMLNGTHYSSLVNRVLDSESVPELKANTQAITDLIRAGADIDLSPIFDAYAKDPYTDWWAWVVHRIAEARGNGQEEKTKPNPILEMMRNHIEFGVL